MKCGVDQVQCGTVSAAGAVCGTVCDYVVNGTRTHLAGGRLDLTSTPKACITIPNGLGEFCHEF